MCSDDWAKALVWKFWLTFFKTWPQVRCHTSSWIPNANRDWPHVFGGYWGDTDNLVSWFHTVPLGPLADKMTFVSSTVLESGVALMHVSSMFRYISFSESFFRPPCHPSPHMSHMWHKLWILKPCGCILPQNSVVRWHHVWALSRRRDAQLTHDVMSSLFTGLRAWTLINGHLKENVQKLGKSRRNMKSSQADVGTVQTKYTMIRCIVLVTEILRSLSSNL